MARIEDLVLEAGTIRHKARRCHEFWRLLTSPLGMKITSPNLQTVKFTDVDRTFEPVLSNVAPKVIDYSDFGAEPIGPLADNFYAILQPWLSSLRPFTIRLDRSDRADPPADSAAPTSLETVLPDHEGNGLVHAGIHPAFLRPKILSTPNLLPNLETMVLSVTNLDSGTLLAGKLVQHL